MGKEDRLGYRVEPFAALFWALGIVLYIYPTPDPVRRPGITPPPYTKDLLWSYMLVQFSTKTVWPSTLILSSYIIYP